MLLYESRKLASACRKAFIENVYGESEDMYDSVFKNDEGFDNFLNKLVKPALPSGWELSGRLDVDDATHKTLDVVILYKELGDGSFCALSASIVEDDVNSEPTYSIEFSDHEINGSNVFASDDLDGEFIPVYNSLQSEDAEYVEKFDFGGKVDPLETLMDFVGTDVEDRHSIRYAIAKKLEDSNENNEEESNNNESDSNDLESNKEINDENDNFSNSGEVETLDVDDEDDVSDLIPDYVKADAKNEIDSW